MQHGILLQLVDCSIDLPECEMEGGVAFVPEYGWLSANYHRSTGWEATRTKLEITPTYWLRPYKIPEHFKALLEISERLEADPEFVKRSLDFFEKLLNTFSYDTKAD